MGFDCMFFLHLRGERSCLLRAVVLIFACILVLSSCVSRSSGDEEPDPAAIREALAESNKLMIAGEDQEIRDFIHRHNWQMEESGSGLRFMWIERGDGDSAQKGLWARIHYRIFLLTGDLLYASSEDEPKQFRIGQGGVESGLEEGILMMREGDKVRLIMPPHLAHGLPGDGVRIPQRASIVYEVELIELTE